MIMRRKIISLIYLWILSCLPIIAQIGGQVNIDINELSLSKKNGYDVIQWNASMHKIQQVGAPELPVTVQTFVVPLNVKVTGITITVKKRSTVEQTLTPYPAQPIPPETGEKINFVEPDSAIYKGNSVFPQKRAEIIADYNEMGYHLVKVQLNPVEYDPVLRKIHINSLDFALRYEQCENQPILPERQSVRRANLIKKTIRSMVANPQDVDRFTNTKVHLTGSSLQTKLSNANASLPINVISEQIPDYIIISSKELKGEFQRLADWKIKKGIPTIIKDVESIQKEYQGSDLAEKIHSYLQECYRKWGAGLFVLLGGDINIIPTRYYMDLNEEYPSDAYYMDLNSSWNANKNHIYAEISDGVRLDKLCYIGRAPAENLEEAKVFVDKVLTYERMDKKIDKNYIMNYLASVSYTSIGSDGFLSPNKPGIINSYLSNYPQLNKWYIFTHYNCSCPKHDKNPMFEHGEELNRESLLAALQDGGASDLNHFHIVYHTDHSHPRAMGASSIDKHESIYTQDVDNLNNGDYLQIVITESCKPAKIDEDCIAEHFINNSQGGAVAFIGDANEAYPSQTAQYNRFLRYLHTEKISSLGILYSLMPESGDIAEYKSLHLLGDPEMPVWSTVPQKLEVNVTPTQIEAGTNTITVQISNLPAGEEATVCLMKDAEAYTVVTVNDTKPHSFTFTPKTSGEMTVTVTARNFIPFEKSIPVTL